MFVRRVAGHPETRAQERRKAGRPAAQDTGGTTRQPNSSTQPSDSGAGQIGVGVDGRFGVGIGAGMMLETDGTIETRII